LIGGAWDFRPIRMHWARRCRCYRDGGQLAASYGTVRGASLRGPWPVEHVNCLIRHAEAGAGAADPEADAGRAHGDRGAEQHRAGAGCRRVYQGRDRADTHTVVGYVRAWAWGLHHLPSPAGCGEGDGGAAMRPAAQVAVATPWRLAGGTRRRARRKARTGAPGSPGPRGSAGCSPTRWLPGRPRPGLT